MDKLCLSRLELEERSTGDAIEAGAFCISQYERYYIACVDHE